jgi:hypothetical protein
LANYTVTLRDIAYGEYSIENASGVWVGITDGVKASDYIRRDTVKAYLDSGVPSDVVSKDVFKPITDVSTCVDRVARDIERNFLFDTVGLGFATLEVGKKLVEEVKVSDNFSKTLSKFRDILETCIVSDRVARDTVTIISDSVVGEFVVSRNIGKKASEVISVSERVMRDIYKPFSETLTVTDILYKNIAKNIVDQILDTGRIERGFSKAFRDKGEVADVVAKVGYKLAGLDVRRVYFFSGAYTALRDIIEDTDHNVKVDVASILLEAMKRVKEKLEE